MDFYHLDDVPLRLRDSIEDRAACFVRRATGVGKVCEAKKATLASQNRQRLLNLTIYLPNGI